MRVNPSPFTLKEVVLPANEKGEVMWRLLFAKNAKAVDLAVTGQGTMQYVTVAQISGGIRRRDNMENLCPVCGECEMKEWNMGIYECPECETIIPIEDLEELY